MGTPAGQAGPPGRCAPRPVSALPNFFAAGDGAGITRGLAQAGASGVRAARAVAARVNHTPV